MSAQISRKSFLRLAGAGAGALALDGLASTPAAATDANTQRDKPNLEHDYLGAPRPLARQARAR